MKKLLSVFLIAGMLLAMRACGGAPHLPARRPARPRHPARRLGRAQRQAGDLLAQFGHPGGKQPDQWLYGEIPQY